MNTIARKVLWTSLSALSGGIIGYLIGDLVAYNVLQRKFESKEEGPRPKFPNNNNTLLVQPDIPTIDYTKYSKKELAELTAPYRSNEEETDISQIHIISSEEWTENATYEKEVLSYYVDDATYSNIEENIIANPQDLLGSNPHLHFGEDSEDPDIVYIRNEANQTDYELIRIHGSYSSLVLGMPQEEVKKKSSARRSKRKKDDEEDIEE